MITILHNPRCSKSRQGVRILEESGRDFEIKLYLKDLLSEKELKEIVDKLNMSAIDLVRTKEAIWKANYEGNNLSETDVIKALVAHPKLIERPIIIHKNKGIIGRPPENIKSIL